MTLRGGSALLSEDSVGVETRHRVAGFLEVGGPGSSQPGSWGEAGLCQAPCREAQGPDPARRTATPRRPQQCKRGRGPGPGIGGPTRGPPLLLQPLPHAGLERARSPPRSLEPGCPGLCKQLFQGSFTVQCGAGTSVPSPSAYFKNTGVKNTPSLPPQAREGRRGGTWSRAPTPPAPLAEDAPGFPGAGGRAVPGPLCARPGPPFPCETLPVPLSPASLHLCSPFLREKKKRERERKGGKKA